MVEYTFESCNINTFRIMQRENILKSPPTFYFVNGVLVGKKGNEIAPVKLFKSIVYYRNFLPQSAIKDGKATLELTPGEKYVLIRYWTETEGEELISKQEVVGTYTASAKIGKVSITGLDDTSLYKLATAETEYTPAYEDVFTDES